MSEIWETRVCDSRAVMHGCATRYIAWKLDVDGHWRMTGAFWSRDEAEESLA